MSYTIYMKSYSDYDCYYHSVNREIDIQTDGQTDTQTYRETEREEAGRGVVRERDGGTDNAAEKIGNTDRQSL